LENITIVSASCEPGVVRIDPLLFLVRCRERRLNQVVYFCLSIVFTARRYAVVFAVSIRLSVCHVHAIYPDGWRYRQTFCRPSSPIIL